LGFSNEFFGWLLSENNEHETPLDLCAKNGNKDIIIYMYSIIIKTNEKKLLITENRKGVFHYAAMNNQCYPIIFFYEKLQKFFKKETIIDIPSEHGITPLHYACINGSKNAVDILLDLGANINAVDNDGNNCLHYAVNSKNISLLKKLLVRGADKNIRNKKGQLPYDLAINNGYKNIADILSAKNSIIHNPYGNNHEITRLRSSHNNITLFVIILFMGLAKWIYLSRIYYIYEGDIKYDIVPFVYEIEKMKSICYYGNKGSYDDCEINNTFIDKSLASIGSIRKDIKNVSQLFKSDTIGYNFLEKTYIIGWALSSFEIIILFFILKFMCFSSHIFIKKKSFRKQYSLIKLFESNKNICVKCRIPKDDTTIHCIVCNGCVREFDHHCSWLNICICKKNLGWFRGFLYLFCLYILSNLVFFTYSK
jgi:palmitoyltransferase